jgi:hypothetical protein
MKKISKKQAWAIGALVAIATPVWAHHSTAAYDYSRSAVLEGTVKEFQWTNPHMFIHLVVRDAAGKSVEWSIECGTPNINVRHGWKQTDLKPGDKVTAKIHPMRNVNSQAGGEGGTLMTVTLPDGRTLYGPGNDIAGGPPPPQ